MPPRKKAGATAAAAAAPPAAPATAPTTRRSLRSSSKDPEITALDDPEKVLHRRRQRSVSRPTTSSSNASTQLEDLAPIKEEKPSSPPSPPHQPTPAARIISPVTPVAPQINLIEPEDEPEVIPAEETAEEVVEEVVETLIEEPIEELFEEIVEEIVEEVIEEPTEEPVEEQFEEHFEIPRRKFPTPINPILREPSSVIAARERQKSSSWFSGLPTFSFSLFGSKTAPQPSKHQPPEATRPAKRPRDSPEKSVPSKYKPNAINRAPEASPSPPVSPSPAEAQRPMKRVRESLTQSRPSAYLPVTTPRRGLPPVTPRRRLPEVIDRSIRSRRKQADDYKQVLSIQKEQEAGLRPKQLTSNEKDFVETTVHKQKLWDEQDERLGRKRAAPEPDDEPEQQKEVEDEPPSKRSRLSGFTSQPPTIPTPQPAASPVKYPKIGMIAPGTWGISDAFYDDDEDDDTTIMSIDEDQPPETSVVLADEPQTIASTNIFSTPSLVGSKRKFSEAELDERMAQLDEREAALNQREADLSQREEEFNKRIRLSLPEPPPAPSPAHALLPPITERMAHQKAQAQKYAPKRPTGLREVNVASPENKENLPVIPNTRKIQSIFPFPILPAGGVDSSDALQAFEAFILPQLH